MEANADTKYSFTTHADKNNTRLALNELLKKQSIKTKTGKKNFDLEKKKYSLKMLEKIIYQIIDKNTLNRIVVVTGVSGSRNLL